MASIVETAQKALGLKTETEKMQEEKVGQLDSLFEFAKRGRLGKEVEAFANDNAYYARNPVRVNLSNNKAEVVGDKTTRVQINKVNRTVRGVTAWLTKEHPMVSFRPGLQSEDAYISSQKMQSWAMHHYDALQMKKKIKKICSGAGRHSMHSVKIMWDEDATAPTKEYTLANDDGSPSNEKSRSVKGRVCFEPVDFFDLYWDPVAEEKTDARFVIHSMRRTIDELKNNPLYENSAVLAADRKLAESDFKNSTLQRFGAGGTINADPGLETVIVREIYKKEWSAEQGKFIIMLYVVTANGVMLREQQWPLDEFPFEMYHTEIVDSVYSGDGIVKHIRPLNKSLNTIVSQVEETVRIMGKLNWLVARGSKVNVIRDVTGDWIEYDASGGRVPQQTQPANIPAYIREHISNLESWIDDISGTHEAFYGNSPFSRASGEVVKNLQEGDSNSLSTMRDNLDDFLVRSFMLMFKTEKYHRPDDVSIEVPMNTKDGMGKYRFSSIKSKDIDLTMVCQVRSGSALPYSDREKSSMAFDLWDKKIIQDPAMVLRLAGLSDVTNTLGDDELDIERQLEENETLINAKHVDDPVMGEDHNVHIRVLDQLIKSPEYKKLKKKSMQLIQDHRDKHQTLLIKIQKVQAALNVEPIKRSETYMLRQDIDKLTPVERTDSLNKFGVTSDAAEIQSRGGWNVQDPADAERQAQKEDMNMMDGQLAHVSFSDNHQVHMETHSQIMNSPEFKQAPTFIQRLFNEHYNQHKSVGMGQQMEKGLIPQKGGEVQPPVAPVVTAKDKEQQDELAKKLADNPPTDAPADIPAKGNEPAPGVDTAIADIPSPVATKPADPVEPLRKKRKPAKAKKTA